MRNAAIARAALAVSALLTTALLLLLPSLLGSQAEGTGLAANGRIVVTMDDDDIWTMEPDGSDLMQLTDWLRLDGEPAWSPDGTQIAFARDMNGNSDYHIFVMNADGSNQTDLTPNAITSNRHPTWSPDGSRIAFIAVPPQVNGFRIGVINADGSSIRYIPKIDPLTFPWTPSWSPAGNRIVYQDESYHLWMTDLRGRTRQLTDGDDENPDVSPDGNTVVFQRGVDSTDWVFTFTPGEGERQLTFGPSARDRRPAWSPDGSQIVFERNNGEIWIMDSDGTDLIRIFDSIAFEPDWQPLP